MISCLSVRGGDSGGFSPPTPGMYSLSWFKKRNNIHDLNFIISLFLSACVMCAIQTITVLFYHVFKYFIEKSKEKKLLVLSNVT